MSHPSIRTRLILASTLLAAGVLTFSKISAYHATEKSLRHELDEQLLHAASLLTKSAELVPRGVIYEWQEADKSEVGPTVSGLFQFWDVKSGRTVRSPELGEADLQRIEGALNEPVFQTITLWSGATARAVGLRHLPFSNDFGKREMARQGQVLSSQDFPQVVVFAKSTAGLEALLADTRKDLVISGILTLGAIWLGIFLVTRWMLRPLDQLAASLLKRSTEVGTPIPEVPENLPLELVPLAEAFRTSLARVELAREHEKDFAYGAAHQLRTPVAGLLGILEQSVSRQREAGEMRDRIHRAIDITQEVRATIDTLMRVARIKGGVDQVTPESYDVLRSLREVAAVEAARCGQEAERLEWGAAFATEAPVRVVGDPEMFRVLFAVLFENAFRHSPPHGRVAVGVEVQGEWLRIAVENEAPDFDIADSDRLFRPFQRGSRTSVNSPGAGLGLALANDIASHMGGGLSVTGLDGGRIAFVFRMPMGA